MIAFLFLVVSFSLILDLLFRSWGICLMFTPCSVFYITSVLGLRRGMAVSLISALFFSILNRTPVPLELLTYPAVSLLAFLRLRYAGPDSISRQGFSGVLIAVILLLPQSLIPSISLRPVLLFLLPCCLLTMVQLPVQILFLDFWSCKFSFPLYRELRLKKKGQAS